MRARVIFPALIINVKYLYKSILTYFTTTFPTKTSNQLVDFVLRETLGARLFAFTRTLVPVA